MKIVDMLGPQMKTAFSAALDSVGDYFFYGADAAELLADHLRGICSGDKLLMFSDRRTRAAAGDRCLAALRKAGWSVSECPIPDGKNGSDPVTNDTTMNALLVSLPDADAYIAVGSGVVNDLTKWLAAKNEKPYAVYATAASMNGYTAANVAATIGGVKKLFPARAPRIIAADPRVIESAPSRLTTSGLGDVMAKPVSTCDWLFNALFLDEIYSKEVAGIIDQVEPLYLEHPEALAKNEPDAVKALLTALVLSGCAMTLQGSSLPASGGEHLISHTLDMKAGIDGIAHDLHGRQVGVATIFAAALYQRIVAIEQVETFTDTLVFDSSYWGPHGEEVRKECDQAQRNITGVAAKLQKKSAWDAARLQISQMLRDPLQIKDCLRKSGAAYRLEDIGCTREQFCRAVQNCACMRGRFTSMDLGFTLGVLPGNIESIVDEYLIR